MKIVVNSNLFFLEGIEEIETLEEVADILSCFVNEEDILLFSIDEENLLNIPHDGTRYFEERTMFRNNEWVLPHAPISTTSPRFQLWYRPLDRDEIVETLKRDYYGCLCVVIKKGSDFKDLTLILNIFEGQECEVLSIEDRSQRDFISLVLPRLQELLKEQLDVVYSE